MYLVISLSWCVICREGTCTILQEPARLFQHLLLHAVGSIFQGNASLLVSVFGTKMANNQVPSCPFSTMECLQWLAFTPGKIYPLQDFGPEIGSGRLPMGLHPELYGT